MPDQTEVQQVPIQLPQPQSSQSSQLLPSSTTKKVLKNTFYNFLTTIIGRIGGLIFTIIVARLLFPDLFGIYSLALTIILTIATFTDLGVNATLVRYLSESLKLKTDKAKTEARSRTYFLLNFKIILTAIFALLLLLFAELISAYIFHKPSLALPLKLGALYLVVISLQGFFNSIFFALQKINYSAIAEIIFQIVRIALVFVLFMFYKTVSSVFIALIIAFFISFLFLWLIVLRKYSYILSGPRIKLSKVEKKRLFSFFGWLTISSISLVFFLHIDTFMLGIFLPAEFVGYYNVIISIVTSVAALIAFGSVLLPVFTQLEQEKIEKGFKKVFHYVSLIAFPTAVGLAYIIVPAIKVIYGQAYVPLQYSLAIIIAAAILSLVVIEMALTAIFSSLFQAKEKPKIPSLLIIISTIFNVILNYALIRIGISIAPEYGLIGVALATFIARYGNLIGLIIFAKTKLNIKINVSSVIKPLIASIIMLGFLFIADYFVTMSIFTGILMIVAAALIYVIVVFAIKGITKEDFKMIGMFRK
ncbi:MAG: flippase [Candidatus Nanoarchaeia archaeon]